MQFETISTNYNTDYLILSFVSLKDYVTVETNKMPAVSTTDYSYYMSAVNQDKPSSKKIQLEDLIDSKYCLSKPLYVDIKRDGLDFIGSIDDLDIYAFGESELEVLREINRDVTELFEELLAHETDKLGVKPIKWKKILTDCIKSESD